MTFNRKRFKKASFKGATFSFDSSSVGGGIKFADLDYPSSRRDIEFIGTKKKDFTIQCYTDGSRNFKERDQLVKKLENKKAGILKHPLLGSFYCQAITYLMQDSIQKLGKTDFSIEFRQISKEDTILKKSKGFLASLKSKILGDYEAVFDKAFESVKNAKEKFDSATETLQNVAEKINDVANTISSAGDGFGDFSTAINQVVGSANNLVQSPRVLASNLKIAFQNLEVAYNSSKDLFNVCKNLFNINEKDRDAVGNSANSNAIRNNQEEINKMVQVYAIATAIANCVDIDFQNTDEVNQVINDIAIDLSIYDSAIKSSLIQMRAEALNILYEQSVSLPNINLYNVAKPISINILTYSIYGSLDKKEAIRKLNIINDVRAVSGQIKILTENA